MKEIVGIPKELTDKVLPMIAQIDTFCRELILDKIKICDYTYVQMALCSYLMSLALASVDKIPIYDEARKKAFIDILFEHAVLFINEKELKNKDKNNEALNEET